MFMKKILFSILACLPALAIAQTVTVKPETIKVKGEAIDGYEVQLDGTFQEVEDQFLKYVKPLGKIRKGDDASVISLPMIGGKNYTAPLYVLARDKGKGAAWLGIKSAEFPESVKSDIQKLVYKFGVTFYRDKIQVQIDESMRALQAVERQQQKLLSQHKDFSTRLSDNKNEKIQLEKSLENNKLQFDALNIKLDKNKLAQDSVALAGDQIKKVIDMQKEKQRKVN
jgi:hypothetical protein